MAAVGALATSADAVHAQARTIELTLERMVDLTLSDSYEIQQLDLSIDRTRHRLRAERARLRSSVDLELSVPQFESASEAEWNPDIGRNEIIHQNTRRWEAQLSVEQPVVLFGYPTNGYLSLNTQVYRYKQLGDAGEQDIRYYNRYFVQYTQPLFQPNDLRNDIEEAELEFEEAELDFYDDVVEMVDELSGDYFELFEDRYQEVINQRMVENLELAAEAATQVAAADTTRIIDVNQSRVELANAREQLQQSESQFRLQAASLKTRLNLAPSDSISLTPTIAVRPVPINVDRAIEFAMELTPRMRQLGIQRRQNEIELEETEGDNSFRVDLEFSYGREMQNPVLRHLWREPANTYTIDVNAYLPIWDWGERSARIEASRISVRQTDLEVEEATAEIASNVRNEVRNIAEFESRALAMQENLQLATELSRSSLALYRSGSASMLDVIQSFRREADTARNLLDAYLGWRRALLRMQELTYYDFERGVPVLERYGVTLPAA
jgi:outer membrane protein TolC